ncbi:MAG: right-handed parallel beta-helix repeat-containing protein [Planctomycetota bacterium]|jgi:hypothetical protein
MRKYHCLAAIVCLATTIARAADITVNHDGTADHSTIQAAIDAAAPGDTVRVAAGTYRERITLREGVAVIGADEAHTILEGDGQGPVVRAEHVDGTASLEAFTITGGAAASGGGLVCIDASPTITRCTFQGNRATMRGGGIFNDQGSRPQIRLCTFRDNTAMPGFGGGMANAGRSQPTLVEVTFSGNQAERGGAVRNEDGSDADLSDVLFSGNLATSRGGAIDNVDSDPRIADCIFSGNLADDGGGIANQRSSPVIDGCTFSGNLAGLGAFSYTLLDVEEGVLWIVLLAVFLVVVLRAPHPRRWLVVAIGVPLFGLGVLSEAYEVMGGSATTPVLLIAVKAACVLGLVGLYAWYRRTGAAPA